MTTTVARRGWAACRAAVLVAALALPACGDAHPAAIDADVARAAAVRVEASGCGAHAATGGGSFVADGRVLTVAHVVAGADEVTVVLADGTRLTATVAALDRRKDLAVLDVDAEIAPLPRGTMRVGTTGVFVATDPGDAVVRRFRAEAFVEVDANSIDRDGDSQRRAYRIDADVDHGDSGSVLVADGHAAAVVFARSAGRPHTAWATDIREAADLLATPQGASVDTGACPSLPPWGDDDE